MNVRSLFPPQTVPEFTVACADNLRFMADLTSGSIQLIVTSPPYNIGKAYERRIGIDTYLDQQAQVISECVRLLAPSGSICWQVGNHVDGGEVFPLDILLYDTFKRLDLKLRNRIIWHFEHGLHCSKRLSGRHETILWFTRSDEYTFNLDPIRVPSKYPNKKHFKGPRAGELSGNPLGKNPSDVWIERGAAQEGDFWTIPNVKNNHVEKTIHPCQFPVELVERLLLSLTDEGDAVLDPYMGVGSTIIGALKHGRRAFGCDVMPEYVDVAERRIEELRRGTLQTRPMNKPVYDPSKPYGGHK
jgi:adenine-specific DNA-methyltransferase